MQQKKKEKTSATGTKGNPAVQEKRPVKKWFYIILILLPVIFFVLLELALRLFNYGNEIPRWVNATEDKFLLNPDISKRYFYNVVNVPMSNQNAFDKVKKENAFRVFILGESSAAGYPFLPSGDFGKYIRKRLELSYPGNVIEVINLGITAVTTYTVRDLFNGVIEQKPDLVIIYTGHNEYYGALGVGSMESLGNNPFIVNTALYLNKFRTFQLIRGILKSVTGIFSGSGDKPKSGTLMARMAQDRQITYNSDKFKAGLNQYETNISYILETARENKIPVILGMLASNLKDQPPFISTKAERLPEAKSVFSKAADAFKSGEHDKADSLYRYAKDLDALKFRAPEELNNISRRLAEKYGYPVAEVDSMFNFVSPGKITGNNIMVDHLHPTLSGYRLMGKVFYETMERSGYLPKGNKSYFPEETADSAAVANCYFSPLDTVISNYRIIILKNDWPFSEPKSTEYMLKLFNPQNKIDSTALLVIDSRLSWEAGHRQAATYYFNTGRYDLYTYEITTVSDHFPFITEYYDEGARYLLEAKQFNYAYEVLLKGYNYKPSAFITKWLGTIDLSRNNINGAIKYLTESSELDSRDPQVYYNLAGAFVLRKNYKEALEAINKCLTLNPRFPQAQQLKQSLGRN